jgi:hypothetical protein
VDLLRVAAVVATIIGFAVFGAKSSTLLERIVDEVNERRPDGQRFPRRWAVFRSEALSDAYRQLHPTGDLLLRWRMVQMISLACAGPAFWAIGYEFFGMLWSGAIGGYAFWLSRQR